MKLHTEDERSPEKMPGDHERTVVAFGWALLILLTLGSLALWVFKRLLASGVLK